MGNSKCKTSLDSTETKFGPTMSKTIYITSSEDGEITTATKNAHGASLPIHKPQAVTADNTSTTMAHPPIYKGHFSSLLIPQDLIQKRASQLAFDIHNQRKDDGSDEYMYPRDEPLVILCILKGSSPFCHLLMTELSKVGHPYIYEFIRVKSYVGNSSSGNVQIWGAAGSDGGLPKSIQGRHVLVIEDIIDTGLTLSALLPKIREEKPKSLEVCTLLIKRLGEDEEVTDALDINWDLVGFSIPDAFVVGCGLDFNEMYRDLVDIFVLNEKGIAHGGYGDL